MSDHSHDKRKRFPSHCTVRIVVIEFLSKHTLGREAEFVHVPSRRKVSAGARVSLILRLIQEWCVGEIT